MKRENMDKEKVEELSSGEDFHNPLFDCKLIHPLGHFNQSFLLFKGMFIDSDSLKWCKAQVGQKVGPFLAKVEFPILTKATESLAHALEQIKCADKSRVDIKSSYEFQFTK